MGFNFAAYHGYMAKDPKMSRTVGGNKLARGTIAVDRDYIEPATGERPTDFIDFYGWGRVGENLVKFFPKGKACILTGRMESYDVENSDGRKIRKTRLNVLRCYFVGRKSDPPNHGEPVTYEKPSYAYQPTMQHFYAEDLPPFVPSEDEP